MSGPLFGDPIDPNPDVTEAAPDYSAWYPSATAANVVSYPNYFQPPSYPAPVSYPAYLTQPTYAGYPGYPTPPVYAGYPGYSGYPPTGAARPGEATAAGVLSLICAGLLLITGFVVIFAASTLEDPNSPFESSGRTRLFVGAGLMNIVTAALLIIGAVLLLGRARSGRPVLGLATLLCLALGLFWLVQDQTGGGIVVWLLIFCGPVATAALLMSSTRVSNWLAGAPPA